MKNIFSKINLLRGLLLVGMVACIVAILPHSGVKSLSYEINQPWKYPLLTAEFDFPLYRDTATRAQMKDSIDRNFIPFVVRNSNQESAEAARLQSNLAGKLPVAKMAFLESELHRVYQRGIISASLYDSIWNSGHISLRTVYDGSEGTSTALMLDASDFLTPRLAFQSIDSACMAAGIYPEGELKDLIVKAIDGCLSPNILPDAATNDKFLSQEYFNIAAAQGMIKKGQRIVDLGEIVTPQIYTNLTTYEAMLSEREQDKGDDYNYFIGQLLFVLTVGGIYYAFLAINRPRYFASARMLIFLMSIITLFVMATIIMFENLSYGIYLMPFAALPIIVLIFADARTAVFTLGSAVVLTSLIAASPFRFVFMELSAGVMAAYSVHQLTRRSQLVTAAGIAFLVYVATYFICVLIEDGSAAAFSWRIVLMLGINCVILSFAYVLILLIEKIFGFTSAVTLVELSDINNPVLRNLSEEAPGTFQHSIQVSTLAADAARAVGANVQLVRTGALYHDIGKSKSPVFFTENQHGINPHAGLDPETSAAKIIQHVTDGVEIADHHKIPEAIKNFIREHHGRGITKYFYNTAVNERGEDAVNKEDFRYPGPNPRSLETTLLMMADCVEAASRSLREYDEKSISDLVDNIIDSQIKEGLYKDSPISFHDVEIVKRTFKNRLATIYHSRVSYPKLNSEQQENS